MKKGIKYMIILFILLVLLLIAGKIYYDTNITKIHKIEVNTEKLATDQSFSILQISDLHGKSLNTNNNKLLQKVKKENPDIIVLTGDMIDRRTRKLEPIFHFAEKLVAYNQRTYFVSGNHEWDNPLSKEFFNGLKQRNIHMIDNKNDMIKLGENTIQLAGIGDASTNHDDIDQAIDELEDDYYTVLLSHTPNVQEQQYPKQVDLILSGHTHGGQVRLPFIGAIVAPDQGFFPTYNKGMYLLQDNQSLYIDSGVGTSLINVRFFNQSQISLIIIQNK